MKKALIVTLVTGLLVASFGGSAIAGKKKKSAKPMAYTLYMHGTLPSGEAQYADNLANSTGFMQMDTNEPTDPAPRSMFVTNYLVGPNSSCSGNMLFPTWSGALIGKVSGDLKVFLNAAAPPTGKVNVDVFADATGGCDSSLGSTGYVPPVATATVALAPGMAENEIVFEDVKFESMMNIVVMITPVSDGPQGTFYPSQTRLFYDSAQFATRIELSCAPTSGKSCTP